MLPSKNRLKKKKEFSAIFKSGRIFNEDGLVMRVKENKMGHSRFAFVVGKGVSKKAVQRNKIKRRMRAALRVFFSQIKKNTDVIFTVRPSLYKASYAEVEEKIKKLLIKSKLI